MTAGHLYAEEIKVPNVWKKDINLVHVSLHNQEDGSNNDWETVDLNADEELESSNSIDKNPYCQ